MRLKKDFLIGLLFLLGCNSQSSHEPSSTNPVSEPVEKTAQKRKSDLGDTLFFNFRSGMTMRECDSILDTHFDVGRKNKYFKMGNYDFKVTLGYFDQKILTIQLVNNTIENFDQFDRLCQLYFSKYYEAKIEKKRKERKVVYNYQDFILTDEEAFTKLNVEDRRIELSYSIKNTPSGPSSHAPKPIIRELKIKYIDLPNEKKYLEYNSKNMHQANPPISKNKLVDKI